MAASDSTCIGCGCTDSRACPAPPGVWPSPPGVGGAGGCSWLRVDEHHRTGVCSRCAHLTRAWDAGAAYTLHEVGKAMQEARAGVDWAGVAAGKGA